MQYDLIGHEPEGQGPIIIAISEWTRRRAERGMRSYGVLIGSNQGEALLDEISDAVFRLDDLRGDLPTLGEIFSAI
jgi:hypothetical protein